MPSPRRRAVFWAALFALLLGVRLCYINVLWVDEAYGLAAARRLLEGAALYRGLWFDKPPLYAWIYLPFGAATGWALRIGGSLFALLCCWLAARAARALFGVREGYLAAAAMAFFLAFDYPSALVSLAPDLLLVPFVLGMVWALAERRPALASICAAAGLLANAKALLLLPLVLFWEPRAWKRALPVYIAAAFLVSLLAAGWWEPVWRWGALYSSDSPLAHPLLEGLKRTAGWAGFHAALVLGAVVYFGRKDPHRWRLSAWMGLGLVMVTAGERFFPRYYFALLPVLVLAAARGAGRMPRAWGTLALTAALAVPAVRFGTRHIATLRGDPTAMRDLAMFADCREASAKLRSIARPGDTLFVWGYRPELNVLAGLPGATPFLDSQPLTGVLAERHLTRADATAPEIAARNRRRLVETHPTFIADGLGPYNPALAIASYGDLRPWLASYRLVAETQGFRIYRLH
jgi:4-amino-4-deoxy-L-arabinose transferase-like glycosyltransferase